MKHLPGVRNLWADLLSRWAHPTYRNYVANDAATATVFALKRKIVRERSNEFLNLRYDPSHSNFDFPSLDKIKLVQNDSSMTELDSQFLKDNVQHITLIQGIVMYRDKVWIPQNERILILCIMIHGHEGSCGHRSIAHTISQIGDLYFWVDMDKDIHSFVSQCLVCMKTNSGKIIPRPFGESVSGSKPGEVIHMDFLFIADNKRSKHIHKYILVLKDDFSGLIEMIPCEFADHFIVVDSIQMWQARYGLITVLVSDQGSHFVSLVLAEYNKRCRVNGITHHFTVAYCPWSNGTIERVNRDILTLFKRIVLTSIEIEFDMWPYLLPHVMSVINSRSSDRLGGHSPREIFMGISQSNELDLMFNPLEDVLLDIVKSKDLQIYYDNLMTSLDKMHKKVVLSTRQIAERNRRIKNSQIPVNFTIGDFVLVAAVTKHNHKLHAQWKGPFRVLRSISAHVFICENLVTQAELIVHVRRMKFFASSDMNVTVPLIAIITAQDNWATDYIPESVVDSYEESDGSVMVKVKWLGFDELESTWESIEYFYADAPDLVDQFLLCNSYKHNALREFVNSFKLAGANNPTHNL
jgi:hypothetical protein